MSKQMVFCFQNCSDLLWEKVLAFEKKLLKQAEGREFPKKIVSEFFLDSSVTLEQS